MIMNIRMICPESAHSLGSGHIIDIPLRHGERDEFQILTLYISGRGPAIRSRAFRGERYKGVSHYPPDGTSIILDLVSIDMPCARIASTVKRYVDHGGTKMSKQCCAVVSIGRRRGVSKAAISVIGDLSELELPDITIDVHGPRRLRNTSPYPLATKRPPAALATVG